MTDVAKLQLIEAYHHGILTETAQEEFDQLISTDSEFAAELEDYNFLLDGFDMLALEGFEANVQSWEKKHESESTETKVITISATSNHKTQKFNLQRFISVAAAIVGIAFLPLAYSLWFSGPAGAYDAYFSAPMAITGVRGGNDGIEAKEKAKSFALGFYNNKDYTRAIQLLNTYIDQYGNEEYEAIFYLGVSQMVTKNFKAASLNFEHVMENDKSYFAQGAEWMMALTQYKLDNKDNAIRYAEKVAADQNHTYAKQAKEFLAKIK